MHSYASWSATRRRLDALPSARQAAFALACAEGVIGPDGRLVELLHLGWDALAAAGDVTELLTTLEQDPDLDDDCVDATFFALSAVEDQPGAAWWAASRGMDQAFSAAADRAETADLSGSVEVDARSEVAQTEMARQARLLSTAESAPTNMDALEWLRDPNHE